MSSVIHYKFKNAAGAWDQLTFEGSSMTVLQARDAIIAQKKLNKQGGDFDPSKGVAVNIVDEEEHIATLLVTEILGHCEPGEGNAEAHAGRLVHLAKNQAGFVENSV